MTPHDRQNRKVAILKFVRENIPVLPESSRDLYLLARQCKDLGLYSQTTYIGDVANRLWWLRKEMPAAEQERAKRIALAAPDLLAACKSVADGVERSLRLADDKNPICLATLAARVEVLRAAIAKAEGRTQ